MLPVKKIWLLVGVGVLAVLLVLTINAANHPHGGVRRAGMDLDAFSELVERFHAKNGRYPTTNEGLSVALMLTLGEAGRDKHPLDPWGHAYIYRDRGDGRTPKIYSFGPNGIDEDGGGDDISPAH